MKEFFKKLWGKIVAFFKNEKDSIVKPTAVLLCICIVVSLALAVTNKLTQKRIAKLEAQSVKAAMEELVTADKFTERTVSGITFNIAQKDGADIAYIFINSAKGYGGHDSVSVMTAVSPTGTVLNLKVLDVSDETPGRGQNAAKPEFYLQFKDRSDKISINDIDTVAGATITSKAVLSSVNEALEQFRKLAVTPMPLPDETTEETTEETEGTADEKE